MQQEKDILEVHLQEVEQDGQHIQVLVEVMEEEEDTLVHI